MDQDHYTIDGARQVWRFPTLQAARAAATRRAKRLSEPVEIGKHTVLWNGSENAHFRQVLPDGTMRRWEKGEWLLPNERHTADGRIITVEAQ